MKQGWEAWFKSVYNGCMIDVSGIHFVIGMQADMQSMQPSTLSHTRSAWNPYAWHMQHVRLGIYNTSGLVWHSTSS